jgi:hypothetical protein
MMMKRIALIHLLLVAAALDVSAETLLRYENRVARAAEQVARIKSDAEYEASGIEDIRQLVPAQEMVEHEGRRLSVNNTWLHMALDGYEAEDDPQAKKAKLAEIGDRLTALDASLIRAAETSLQIDSNPNSRERLREILNRPEYHEKKESRLAAFIKEIRTKVINFLAEIWRAFGRMLQKVFGSGAEGSIVSMILMIVVLGVLVYFIVLLVMQIRPRRKKARKRTVLGEEIEATATPGDLFEAAMAAARAGDFRGAVRKLYISLLYELSERNLIELEANATNHEYLTRLSQYGALVPPLSEMTDRFDVSWYGLLPTTPEEFAAYVARYKEARERVQTLTPAAAK